ncbi:MAG: ferredoxin [Novosphingobium sp.]|nr:ferredoxin [Novosphingobium sp.]
MLKIQVKADLCCGVGLCVKGDCAKVYQRDDLGYNSSDGQTVPEGLEEIARKGAAACPETAIELIETN